MKTFTGRRRSEIIAPLAYLAVWALVLIVFWCFTDGAGAMGFTLVFLWGVLPLATVIVSLAIGLCDSFGKWKWLGLLVFGVMYMLAEYGTFAMANTVATGNINPPQLIMIPLGAACSLIGMAVGALIRRVRGHRSPGATPSYR